MHPDDGKHELEQEGDEHDVVDSLDGHNDALYHVFEALGTVDSPQWPQHTQHPQDLHYADGLIAAKG